MMPEFKRIAKCTIGNGESGLFWQDDWGEGRMREHYPQLYSFSLNHIVDMINIVMFIDETTPSHVMIGHGLVDLDHVIT